MNYIILLVRMVMYIMIVILSLSILSLTLPKISYTIINRNIVADDIELLGHMRTLQNVRFYTTTRCGWCTKLKEDLIETFGSLDPFDIVDIDMVSDEVRKEIDKLEFRGFPAIYDNLTKEVKYGFTPAIKLAKSLG